MEEYLRAFMEYEDQLFWEKDIDSADEIIKMWLNSDECKALNMRFVSVPKGTVCLLKRDYETCSFWESNNCECIGCSNYKQTDC